MRMLGSRVVVRRLSANRQISLVYALFLDKFLARSGTSLAFMLASPAYDGMKEDPRRDALIEKYGLTHQDQGETASD